MGNGRLKVKIGWWWKRVARRKTQKIRKTLTSQKRRSRNGADGRKRGFGDGILGNGRNLANWGDPGGRTWRAGGRAGGPSGGPIPQIWAKRGSQVRDQKSPHHTSLVTLAPVLYIYRGQPSLMLPIDTT